MKLFEELDKQEDCEVLGDTRDKKKVYFVCAHGLGISGSFVMTMQDYLDRNEIRNYEILQRGYQIPGHLEEIREEDSVFVAQPFREEVEALRKEGKLTSRQVHYVEMPYRPYVSECKLGEEFASGIMCILRGEKSAAIAE